LSRRKSKKIADVTGFGLNSRKSLRKANSLLRYFRAFWLQSGIIANALTDYGYWTNNFFIKNIGEVDVIDFLIAYGSFQDNNFTDGKKPIMFLDLEKTLNAWPPNYSVLGSIEGVDTRGNGRTDSIKFDFPNDPLIPSANPYKAGPFKGFFKVFIL
jgi:hypothetical protein